MVSSCCEACCWLTPGAIFTSGSPVLPSWTTFFLCFLVLAAAVQFVCAADPDGGTAGQGFAAVAGGGVGAAEAGVASGWDVCGGRAVCRNRTPDARGAPDASNPAIVKTIVTELIWLSDILHETTRERSLSPVTSCPSPLTSVRPSLNGKLRRKVVPCPSTDTKSTEP